MTTKRRLEYLRNTVMLAIFLATAGAELGRGQAAVSLSEEAKNAAGFNEFLDRVQAYVKLHNSIESSLPALKPTDQPEKIVNHQQALAQRIRETRRHARRGDMFSEEARKAFRRTVREEFGSPYGHCPRTTTRQGEPLITIHLHLNEPYPDGVPYTTLPP